MYALGDAVVIPEVKLCQIAVQVLFIAVLIHAFHASLEDREIAFQRVHVNRAANVLTSAVLDREVMLKRLADFP